MGLYQIATLGMSFVRATQASHFSTYIKRFTVIKAYCKICTECQKELNKITHAPPLQRFWVNTPAKKNSPCLREFDRPKPRQSLMQCLKAIFQKN